MEESNQSTSSAWWQSGIYLAIALAGFLVIGPTIGLFLAYPFFEGSPFEFLETLASPIGHPEVKLPLYIVQGAATFLGLAVLPAYYFYRKTRKSLVSFLGPVSLADAAMVTGITIFFMGFNSVFIDWNAHLHLPSFLSGFEEWARDREDLATAVTKFLTDFESFPMFALGFFVIAILAAVGEEFVFRGLLQTSLVRATRNPHVAIWLSAVLFSALHLQFFGFVPRMLLGALFGYLYYWSGNLLVPMLAHFVNNGFSVSMMYLKRQELAGMDLENPEAAPWSVVLVFTLITFALLYFFRRNNVPKPSVA